MIFSVLYSMYALILFIAIMLLVFPFAIIASFFGRIRGGNLVYRLCMLWGDIWFALVFIRVKKIYESPHEKNRPYIFVTNHTSYLDAAIIVKAFRQPVRPLGKVEMSRVPVFGFIYEKAIVTVDRSSPENRAKTVSILNSILKKGISILVFPEGTFNMSGKPLKHFFDGAFRVAIESNTPIKPVLFLDAYDRMHQKRFFSLTPGICRCVYLEEVPVAGLTPNDVAFLRQKVFELMEKRLKHYGASWIKSSQLDKVAG